VAGSVNTALGFALQPVSATWSVVAGTIVVGMWSYGASIALYIQAAHRLGATRGQVLFATAPFFGLLLSAVVLGEGIQIQHLIAGVLFVGAIILLLLESHAHQHTHALLTHAHRHRHDDRHHTHYHSGVGRSAEHTHWHEHESMVHAHPHWPDLHHRHTHNFSEQSAE
jgi:hypothetical protein